MYGYDSAFIGGTLELPAFKVSFGLDGDSSIALSSNAVSMFQAGTFFGAILGFFFAEHFGRKPVILGSGVVSAIGSVLQLVGNIAELYAGRVLTGLGVGWVLILLLFLMTGINDESFKKGVLYYDPNIHHRMLSSSYPWEISRNLRDHATSCSCLRLLG